MRDRGRRSPSSPAFVRLALLPPHSAAVARPEPGAKSKRRLTRKTRHMSFSPPPPRRRGGRADGSPAPEAAAAAAAAAASTPCSRGRPGAPRETGFAAVAPRRAGPARLAAKAAVAAR
ncbi:unnamed protein product [Rangifer tarandus platyrhynchus]|uniref:Uncharacterized protein n=2 Tax=Rangifer tarandus platyrhynchus TaxID=3082113 RepID=A0ABN8YEI6_RANTA|nr:unnamed protein product [Rangifer tarandus platyrhynchus]CAI9696141.1 unnamed protein product [Rangifer tarandus platyrhynchus]